MADYETTGLNIYWHPDWLGTARLFTTPSLRLASCTRDRSGIRSSPGSRRARFHPIPKISWARTYHTTEGRFLSPDPAGSAAVDLTDPQTLNRYVYVRNNPLAFVDPSGMASCSQNNQYCGLVVFNTPSSLGLNAFATWDPLQATQIPSDYYWNDGYHPVYGGDAVLFSTTVTAQAGEPSTASTPSTSATPPNNGTNTRAYLAVLT